MGLVISFLGSEWKRRPFFFFFFFFGRLGVFFLGSGADTEPGRQPQPGLCYCGTPSASEGSGNFLSFFFSVEFLSSLMYLTRV